MILDSLFLITCKHISNHNKLPEKITVRRPGYKRAFYMPTIVELAAKVANVEPPEKLRRFNQVCYTLHKAICALNREHAKNPYYAVLKKKAKAPPFNPDNILDLRDVPIPPTLGTIWLLAVKASKPFDVTPNHRRSVETLLKNKALVIVDEHIGSSRIQTWLALRGYTTLVATVDELKGMELPEYEQWSDVGVGYM